MQNFRVLAAFSKFSAYLNNCTGCIISAFQENLSLPLQYSFYKFSRILPRAEFLRLGWISKF